MQAPTIKQDISLLLSCSLFSLGVAVFVGTTFIHTIGVVNGVALVGFSTLLSLPFFAYGLHFHRAAYPIKEKIYKAYLLNVAILAVTFFAGLAASHAICNSLGSLKPFSFTDALEFGGIHMGFTLGSLIALRLCKKGFSNY